MPANPTYYQGDLRADLLQAAAESIDEHGIAALSLREVARRVGVSHAAPAHHFGDKAGLFTALATDSFRRFAQSMAEAVEAQDPNDPLDRLDASGAAYIDFALSNRARFEVMFRPEVLNRDDLDYVLAAGLSSSLLTELVIAAQEAGWASDRDPESVVLAMWGVVHGLATLANQGNLASRGSANDDDSTEELLQEVRGALRAVRGGLA